MLVDPLLQLGSWGDPSADGSDEGSVIEAALLPGVTDSVAATVIEVAATLGLSVDDAATGRRYVVRTSTGRALDESERERLATRLLSNAVIERVALGTIEPAFAHASTPAPIEHVEVRGLDDTALAALNRERGMALDPAELRVIADWFEQAGRAPTDVELETLAQTWSEHCAHKTFRARVVAAGRPSDRPLLAQPARRHRRASTPRSSAVGVRRQRRHRRRSAAAPRSRSRPRRTTTRRRSSRSAARTPASAA